MAVNQKLILVGTAIGLIGLIGVVRLVHADPSTSAIVQVAETREQGRETKETRDDSAEEQQEAMHLQALAKITAQQAQQSAEAALGGKASRVKLENEEGNLVYAVVIGQKEAMVDAGNGKVLASQDLTQAEQQEPKLKSSIQIAESSEGDGDGETNDDGK